MNLGIENYRDSPTQLSYLCNRYDIQNDFFSGDKFSFASLLLRGTRLFKRLSVADCYISNYAKYVRALDNSKIIVQ